MLSFVSKQFFFFYNTAMFPMMASKPTKKGSFWFKGERRWLQKSTSQPELSSGGGSSLSSGKLSKLLVSTADVTWRGDGGVIYREQTTSEFTEDKETYNKIESYGATYIRNNRRCQGSLLQALPVKALKPS